MKFASIFKFAEHNHQFVKIMFDIYCTLTWQRTSCVCKECCLNVGMQAIWNKSYFLLLIAQTKTG